MEYFFYNTDASAIHEAPRPRYPLLIEGGFAALGGDRKKFGEQFERLTPGDMLLMYENGVGVVAGGTVLKKWDGVTHTKPRYYTASELLDLTGGPQEYRIAVDWFLDLRDVPISLSELGQRFGSPTSVRGAIRPIKTHRDAVRELIEERQATATYLPGELTSQKEYSEGALRQILVNAYERNRDAVHQCKQHHGTACVICGFDFETVYGVEFAGFIHVHHLRPLSLIASEYQVDPVNDLCPVCPNCHAVIHFGGKLRSTDDVKQLLAIRLAAKGSPPVKPVD